MAMLHLAAGALTDNDVTVLLLSLALLLGLARLLGETARYLKQPAVLGEILAGVLLGPTVLGAITPMLEPVMGMDIHPWLFPPAQSDPTAIARESFILLCATLLLLVVGLEVDLSTVWRQGKTMVLVSLCGIALPFSAGYTLAMLLPPEFIGRGAHATPVAFALFLGIAMSITALPVIAKILMDLNLAKSDMGVLVISSAMLNDVVGWIGFAVVLALVGAAAAPAHDTMDVAAPGLALTITLTLGFLVFMLTAGRWLCHKALPWVQARWAWPGGVLAFVFTVGLACAAFTSWLGIHSIFGAFIAGIAIGDSDHLTARTRDTIEKFVNNFFSPLFFASIGIGINFATEFNLLLVLIVLVLATVGKVLGSYLGARLAKMGKRESWAVGFGMAAQGAVGIILGQLALAHGLITEPLMVAVVTMAVGTSLLAGPAMQRVLSRRPSLRLTDLTGDRHLVLNLAASGPEHAIHELAGRAAEITGLDKHLLTTETIRRERIMPTGLPDGIAVPHARLDGLTKPTLVVGRSRQGIDFNAADGSRAKLIWLLLSPTQDPESQIELLGLVARAMSDSDVRQRLLTAAGPNEFRAAINQAQDPA